MWDIARCVAQANQPKKEAQPSPTKQPDTIVLRRRPRTQSRSQRRKPAAA
jgi:hypothetical protein